MEVIPLICQCAARMAFAWWTVTGRISEYRAHLWIRNYPQRGLYLFFLTAGKLRRRQ